MEEGLFQNQFSSKRSQKSSKNKFIFIAFAIILLTVVILGGKSFIGGKSGDAVITPTPDVFPTEEIIFPTDTPYPTATPEATIAPTSMPTKTPTPRPTSNPLDKETGLNRSQISVDIKNGSGTAGAASKMADTLRGFGYSIAGTGNADNYDYEKTTISVKPGKEKYLSLLEKDLSASYSIGTKSADLSASSSADAVVIIGK